LNDKISNNTETGTESNGMIHDDILQLSPITVCYRVITHKLSNHQDRSALSGVLRPRRHTIGYIYMRDGNRQDTCFC